MIVDLPYPPDRYDAPMSRRAMDMIHRAFQRVASTERAVSSVLLLSPDENVWRVTVDNAGVLHTVKLPKGQPV